MKKGKNTATVSLRQRTLKSGNIQQFLYIYVDGKERYESLGASTMILSDDKPTVKKEKIRLAEKIRDKREEELKTQLFGFEQTWTDRNPSFFDYFDHITAQKREQSQRPWLSCKYHILLYCNDENLKFNQITLSWLEGFKNYLLNEAENVWDLRNVERGCKKVSVRSLHRSTARQIFNILKTCLHRAVADGIIPKDISKAVKGIESTECLRNFLYEEELKRLAETPCQNEMVRRAFLFSCMSGLRYSDVKNLKWVQISMLESGRARIARKMVKTSAPIYLDLNAQATQYLGEPKSADTLVFEGLNTIRGVNYALEKWCKDAKITKKITFHCARHTHAVLLLTKGVDIYTISKLLGHANIATTQIYAKIIDDTKRDAVDKLDGIL